MMQVPQLYLVQDNAPFHQTARQINNTERQSLGIITLDWPSKSHYLNQTERIWEYEKDISTWKFIGAGRALERVLNMHLWRLGKCFLRQ